MADNKQIEITEDNIEELNINIGTVLKDNEGTFWKITKADNFMASMKVCDKDGNEIKDFTGNTVRSFYGGGLQGLLNDGISTYFIEVKQPEIKKEKENKPMEENIKTETTSKLSTNSYIDYFVKSTAEFDAFADFEPITNLTAKEAVSKFEELRNKGLNAGIGINIPNDIVFDDPEGNGITILVTDEKKLANFNIFGENFISDLNIKSEKDRSLLKNRIEAYEALYNELVEQSIPAIEPEFVYNKKFSMELSNIENEPVSEQRINSNVSIEIKPVSLEEILGAMEMRAEVTPEGKIKVFDLQRQEYIDNRSDLPPFDEDNWTFNNAGEIFERLDVLINDYYIHDMQEQLEDSGIKITGDETLSDLCSLYKTELEKGNDKLSLGELNLAMGIVNPDTVIITEKDIVQNKTNIHDEKINYVLEKLAKAGIEVVTDKEEFDRILGTETVLQKMSDENETNLLFLADEKELKGFAQKVDDWKAGGSTEIIPEAILQQLLQYNINANIENPKILSWQEIEDYFSARNVRETKNEVLESFTESQEKPAEKELKEECVARLLENQIDFYGFDTNKTDDKLNSEISVAKWDVLEKIAEKTVSKELDLKPYAVIQEEADKLLMENSVFQECIKNGIISEPDFLLKTENKKDIELTAEDIKNAKALLPKEQYQLVLGYTQGEEGEHFKGIIKEISSKAEAIKGKREIFTEDEKHPLAFKYIMGASSFYFSEWDGGDELYGYVVLNGNTQDSEWGYTSLEELKNSGSKDRNGFPVIPEMIFYGLEDTIEKQISVDYPELTEQIGIKTKLNHNEELISEFGKEIFETLQSRKLEQSAYNICCAAQFVIRTMDSSEQKEIFSIMKKCGCEGKNGKANTEDFLTEVVRAENNTASSAYDRKRLYEKINKACPPKKAEAGKGIHNQENDYEMEI